MSLSERVPPVPIFATIAAVLVLGAALALAACGGDDSPASGDASSSSSSAEAKQERAQTRLRQCLRKEGVELPEPGQGGGGPGNVDRSKLEAAINGPCKEYRQEAFGNPSQQDQAELRDRLTKFTSCMRRNGVDIPDIQPGEGGPPAQIDQDDPKVQKATEACRDQLPRGGPGGGGGPGQ